MKEIIVSVLLVLTGLQRWEQHRDLYDEVMESLWADFIPREEIAAQIYQESRWNPRAELKTSREYGFGLGQITKAWNSKGELRFDKFKELTRAYKELKGWEWKDRFDTKKQIMAVVLEDKRLWNLFSKYDDVLTRKALMYSAYNGGTTLLYREIELCRKDPLCDEKIWFCNIADKAARSTTPVKGYKDSFWSINRKYPIQIMFEHLPRLKPEK